MGHINPRGRDWSATVNWDDVGKIYAAFTVAWTVILAGGMGWLLAHRHLSFLKIRNIPLAIASTVLLHVYLVKILLAYIVNGHFSCSAEYWIMSIYLPFGIALFQANLVQLQSISEQQKTFLSGQPWPRRAPTSRVERGLRRLWIRWRGLTVIRRNEILIAIGMLAQVLVTGIIFACSSTIRSTWTAGDPGPHIAPARCRKGWQWIPSSIWQLFLTWIYGPYVLFKIRNIRDVHYWRLQTILCVVAGLPGTPLWLAAVYSKDFAPVNKYWVPPMWLAPGIVMIQVVTIFFPIFEAYRSRVQRNTTLDTLKSWDEKRQNDESTLNGSTNRNSLFGSKKAESSTTITSSRRKTLYSMASLEKALAINPLPLLHFAASKEFTGENIVFLMQLRDWRAAWARAHRDHGSVTTPARTSLYNAAVEIYVSSVHNKIATFPVNIEGKIRERLDDLFVSAVVDFQQRDDRHVVDPFNHPSSSPDTTVNMFDQYPNFTPTNLEPQISRFKPQHNRTESDDTIVVNGVVPAGAPASPQHVVSETTSVPADFDEDIFDDAEQSIKLLVLTNTWPKFVETRKDLDALIGLRDP